MTQQSDLREIPWYRWGKEESEDTIMEVALSLLPDLPEVKLGLEIAQEAHRGIYRDKGGPSRAPYFIHCAATTVGLHQYMKETFKLEEESGQRLLKIVLPAMSCHDVLEDCPAFFIKSIVRSFEPGTLILLEQLTKRGEDWAGLLDRDKRKLIECHRASKMELFAKIMKLVDRLHNLYTWPEDDSFAYGKDAKLQKETKDLVSAIFLDEDKKNQGILAPLVLQIKSRLEEMENHVITGKTE